MTSGKTANICGRHASDCDPNVLPTWMHFNRPCCLKRVVVLSLAHVTTAMRPEQYCFHSCHHTYCSACHPSLVDRSRLNPLKRRTPYSRCPEIARVWYGTTLRETPCQSKPQMKLSLRQTTLPLPAYLPLVDEHSRSRLH